MSENALTGALPSEEVILEGCVELIVGVWQVAQPIALNNDLPREIEAAPPGVVIEGVGGARSRMNSANKTMSEGTSAFCAEGSAFDATVKLVASSGYPVLERFRQFSGSPLPSWSSPGSGRSCPKISLVIPISTL